MAQINQLASISNTQVSNADNLPLYSNTNGSTFKWSLSNLLSWLTTNFARQDYITTVSTPSDGFSINVTDDGQNRWMLLRPTGACATGTVVLPSVSNAVDGQEILFTTTYPVTTFTIDGNGASEVNGAPTVLASGDTFTLRFNYQTQSWYLV